jgi:hypothetical protein
MAASSRHDERFWNALARRVRALPPEEVARLVLERLATTPRALPLQVHGESDMAKLDALSIATFIDMLIDEAKQGDEAALTAIKNLLFVSQGLSAFTRSLLTMHRVFPAATVAKGDRTDFQYAYAMDAAKMGSPSLFVLLGPAVLGDSLVVAHAIGMALEYGHRACATDILYAHHISQDDRHAYDSTVEQHLLHLALITEGWTLLHWLAAPDGGGAFLASVVARQKQGGFQLFDLNDNLASDALDKVLWLARAGIPLSLTALWHRFVDNDAVTFALLLEACGGAANAIHTLQMQDRDLGIGFFVRQSLWPRHRQLLLFWAYAQERLGDAEIVFTGDDEYYGTLLYTSVQECLRDLRILGYIVQRDPVRVSQMKGVIKALKSLLPDVMHPRQRRLLNLVCSIEQWMVLAVPSEEWSELSLLTHLAHVADVGTTEYILEHMLPRVRLGDMNREALQFLLFTADALHPHYLALATLLVSHEPVPNLANADWAFASYTLGSADVLHVYLSVYTGDVAAFVARVDMFHALFDRFTALFTPTVRAHFAELHAIVDAWATPAGQ